MCLHWLRSKYVHMFHLSLDQSTTCHCLQSAASFISMFLQRFNVTMCFTYDGECMKGLPGGRGSLGPQPLFEVIDYISCRRVN